MRRPHSLKRWAIRPYEDEWLSVMKALAPILRRNYPSGDQWLSRRLDDVQAGGARAYLAFVETSLRGVAIETPKPKGQVKLSTLWVAPEDRNVGVGGALLDCCVQNWLQAGTPRSWVTVGATARDSLTRLLIPRGFRETAVEFQRYGPDRHEWVLHWTPEHHHAERSGPLQHGRDAHALVS